MQTTDDYLWFDNRTDEKLVRERIEEQAKTIKRLTISNQAFLQNGLFHGLLLPELQELEILSLFYFYLFEKFEPVLSVFHNLRTFSFRVP